MNKFHSHWILGFFFILLDINILIDWVPDFIGWIIIAAAFSKGSDATAGWGKWGAILAAVLSVPLVLQSVATLPESDIPLWLDVIFFARQFAEFTAYAAFFIISDELLERNKQSLFSYVFLGYLLVWMLWQHLYMHFEPNDAENTTTVLGLAGLVFMFCFFVNVIKRRNEWKWKEQVEAMLIEADAEESNGNVY